MPRRPHMTKPVKNPAAVALGKLGGLKGGKARAAKLSAKRRKEFARKATNGPSLNESLFSGDQTSILRLFLANNSSKST